MWRGEPRRFAVAPRGPHPRWWVWCALTVGAGAVAVAAWIAARPNSPPGALPVAPSRTTEAAPPPRPEASIGGAAGEAAARPAIQTPAPTNTAGAAPPDAKPLAAPEDSYRGRTASEWLADLRSGEGAKRFRALVAFSQMTPQGQEALGEILRAVAEKDPSLRHVAVLALAGYGPRARPALPALLETLNDRMTSDTADAAVRAIGRMGPEAKEAVPALIQRLRAVSNRGARPEAEALCRIGAPEGIEAVIQHVDLQLFKNAHAAPYVEALGYAGEAAVPQLQRWLEAPPEEYGQPLLTPVLRAVARIGRPAQAVAALLDKYRRSPVQDVSTWAEFALLRVAPERVEEPKAIPLFIERLGRAGTSPDPAELALIRCGERAVPEIIKAGSATPPRSNAFQLLALLGKMGPQAHEALPLLTAVARTKGHRARGAALGALGPVGMPVADLLPILTEALTDSSVRNPAASALRDLGGAARPALPELRRYLRDPDDNVRNAVTDAVNRIEAEPAGAAAPPRQTAAEEF